MISCTVTATNIYGSASATAAAVGPVTSADPVGEVLVYDWQPLASWIDGVALANRDAGDVRNLSNWTNPAAATVGASLPKAVVYNGGQDRYCFNRAPDGTPSLEVNPRTGEDAPMLFYVQLYDELGRGSGPWPRHMRSVMEIRLSLGTDPDTYVGQSIKTAGYTSYRSFEFTHRNTDTAMKFFNGLYAGEEPKGGGNACWWNDETLPIDRAAYRATTGQTGADFETYTYNFDRPNKFGGSQEDQGEIAYATDPGVNGGCWFRLEVEVFLCSPSVAESSNARRSTSRVRPTGGDGWMKVWLTKDIDGDLGTPGTRQLVRSTTGIIHFPWRDDMPENLDNMHTLATLGGVFFDLHYGGSIFSQAEAHAWIRRLKVYRS